MGNGEIDMADDLARLIFVVGATAKDASDRIDTSVKATRRLVTVNYGDEITAQIKSLDFIGTDVTTTTLWIQ